MLPRRLLEGAMSLDENQERRALVFDIMLDTEGCPVSTSVCWGRICSRWTGSFSRVQEEFYDLNRSAGYVCSPALLARRWTTLAHPRFCRSRLIVCRSPVRGRAARLP